MSRVKTIQDIITDPRVQVFHRNGGGNNIHSVVLNDGYECWGAGSILGSVREICEDLNNWTEHKKATP